jgi:hypothetical protein
MADLPDDRDQPHLPGDKEPLEPAARGEESSLDAGPADPFEGEAGPRPDATDPGVGPRRRPPLAARSPRGAKPTRPPRRPGRPGRPRRRVILATIVAVLIVGGLIDRAGASQPAASNPPPALPVVAASSSLSSSWFCGGAHGPAAAGTLIIANPTAGGQQATVTIVASMGPSPAPSSIAIPAGSRRAVRETVASSGAWVAATVTLDGGGGVVEQQLSGPLGTEVSPCATAGSTSWYFPSGTTLRNADDVVSLYNPYPANAIVDLSFVTNQGPEDPNDFQAILVPGGSVVPVDLGTHLRRRSSIATSVSVRAGQVVACCRHTDLRAGFDQRLGRPRPGGGRGVVGARSGVVGQDLVLAGRGGRRGRR